MTLYRWWRSMDATGAPGRVSNFEKNIAMPTVGITEGQTATRIIGNHFVWHNPSDTDPTITGHVLSLPCRWLIVWDDGTDPNIGTGDLDYMLTAHTHDILHQGSWFWTDMFGAGFGGGPLIYGQMFDGVHDPRFEIKAQRRWNSAGASVQYPRYVSKTYTTEEDSRIVTYKVNMDIALLAATPDA